MGERYKIRTIVLYHNRISAEWRNSMKDTKLEKIDLFGEPASTSSYTNAMLKRNKDAIASLRPIDDIMFEKLMENPKVCEEILRIILDDDTLSVLEVV